MLCSFVAGILHYLFLVTFFWMCIEGIQLYVMLVEVFESENSPVKWYYLSAYGKYVLSAKSLNTYYFDSDMIILNSHIFSIQRLLR